MKLRILQLTLICFFAFTANAQLDRSKVPTAQPNPGINIPTPNVFKLDNGLQVIVVENHKQPTVSFQLYVDHQPITEGEKVGTSDLFGELLGSGTETIAKDQFDEKMDFMGASFSPSSRGFFASSLTKHTPKLLSLLSSVVMSPAFPEDEFDRIKSQSLANLTTTASDASSMASNVAGIVKYGSDHPYGEVMTEKTVSAVTLEDVKSHYNTYFKPNYAYLVIVGDINEADAKSYANKYFGSWAKGDIEEVKYPEIKPANGDQVYFVDKPGAVQSVININQTVNIKPGHEDEIRLRVLNAILGGGSFSARLMSNLREDKAYTYGCYSRINSDEIMGSFYAGGAFRNEVTDSAITQILMEINLIAAESVKATELDLVKKSMTGAFARSLENPQTVARFALNTIRYNLPSNYYATYLQNLEKVTINDLLMVADKYLAPKKLNIVVVGNSEVADKLTQFDSDGKITYKNAFGEDVVPMKAVAEGVTAQTIVDNYLFKVFNVSNADEMSSKMAKIKYIQSVSTSYIAQMDANLVLTSYKSTDKSASIMKAGPQTVQKEWFDGAKGGSFVMMQGKKELTEEEVKKKQVPSFPFSQVHYFNNENYVVELLGIQDIDGADYYKLKVNLKDDEDFTYEYYNVETGMLEMEESFSTDEEGNAIEVKVKLSDYKTFGKKKYTLLMPAKSVMETQGQKLEFDVKSVTIKKKAKTKAFSGEF